MMLMPFSFWVRRAVRRAVGRALDRAERAVGRVLVEPLVDIVDRMTPTAAAPKAPKPPLWEELHRERDELAGVVDAAVDLVRSLPRCWHGDCARTATHLSTHFQDGRCDACDEDGDELEYAPALRVLFERLTAGGYLPPVDTCSFCTKKGSTT